MVARTPGTDSPAGHIRLRYWAGARAAAGVEEDLVASDSPVSLDDLRSRAKDLHRDSDRFAAVLETCSVLVGDRPVGRREPAAVIVLPGETVEFLPPFAGG